MRFQLQHNKCRTQSYLGACLTILTVIFMLLFDGSTQSHAASTDKICIGDIVVSEQVQEFVGKVQVVRIWFTPLNRPFKYAWLSVTLDDQIRSLGPPVILSKEGYWRGMFETETITVGGWAYIETTVPAGRYSHCDSVNLSLHEGDDAVLSVSKFSLKEYSRQGHSCGEESNSCSAGPIAGDSDSDGIINMYDRCPNQNGNASVFTEGCPDIDNDLWADIDEVPECIGSKASQHGVSLSASDRGPKPLSGCAVKFNLRWMGMELLNNSAHYRHGIIGNTDLSANEEDEYTGEEPYIYFAWINGMGDLGDLNFGTAHWCCGDGMDTAIENEKYEPDEDTTGEEFPNRLSILQKYGLTVWPAFSGKYAPIDAEKGLLVSASLFERDWKAKVYPSEKEPDIGDAFSKGGQLAEAFVNVVGGGGSSDGLKAIGKFLISFLDSLFASEPEPIEVDDPDDYSGTDIWAITEQEAISRTANNGAYPFSIDVPMTFDIVECVYYPCPEGYPSKIRVRLNLCLVREGLDENSIQELCSEPKKVLPWPMEYVNLPNGFSALMANQSAMNQGERKIFQFNNKRNMDLMVGLEFGSEFDLKIYNPKGDLFKSERSDTSPIQLEIPNASAGNWIFEVTAIKTPYPQDPFVIKVAASDSDEDQILDMDDNCLNVPNFDQLDSNGNGIGDACESSKDPPVHPAEHESTPRNGSSGGACFISSI